MSVETDTPSILTQKGLEEIVGNIQSARDISTNDHLCFERFLSFEVSVFENLDFNIENLTAISQESVKRPGEVPDWGTKIFESMHFENIIFHQCNFEWLNFHQATFKNVKFIDCNLKGTVFDEAHLIDVQVENCHLNDSSFYKSDLQGVSFIKNVAHFAGFQQAHLQNVRYVDNDLHGSNFFGADASDLHMQDNVKNVLLHHLGPSEIDKPIILISWNNKQPGLAAAKIVKVIQELGGIPFKFNYSDTDVDSGALKEEVDQIVSSQKVVADSHKVARASQTLLHIDEEDGSLPIAKQILNAAQQGDFPEISKIRNKATLWMEVVSGVLLPGGQDIQPLFYGQAPHPKTRVTSDLRRDLFEFAILDAAESLDMPLLGVCRGLQVNNIWKGGSLHQHVDGHLYVAQKYSLTNQGQSGILADIFQRTNDAFIGYAFHHQTVDKIGTGLTVTAISDDGTIKALEALDQPFAVFVQWHPEFKGDQSTEAAKALDKQLSEGNRTLYEKFLDACRLKRF